MENLELIIKYLDGEVIGEEKTLFEQRLKEDSSLEQTFQLVKEVDHTLADDNLTSFISKLKETQILYLASEHPNTENGKNNSGTFGIVRILRNKKLQIAASIAMLLIVSTVFYKIHFSVSPDSLFNNFYQPYEASLITRSSNPTDVSDLIRGIQFYDKGNYANAISKLEVVLLKEKNNTAAHFFIGVSYIETKDFKKAIENLKYVINQNDTAFIEHAQWYLALCYIKTNQNKLATPILSKIVQSKNLYKPMASEILKKLK